jgi:hypothetical protein
MKEKIIEKIEKKFIAVKKCKKAYHLEKLIKEILILLEQLKGLGAKENETIYIHASIKLLHTLNVEVETAKKNYDKFTEADAKRIRKSEYVDSLKKAVNKIEVDIFHVLQ